MDSNLFQNPAFANMSPEKMQFLLSFAGKSKPTNSKDIMPFLLANMKQAKAQNLDFTRPEVQLICEMLSKDLPEAERARVQKLMALFAMRSCLSRPFLRDISHLLTQTLHRVCRCSSQFLRNKAASPL